MATSPSERGPERPVREGKHGATPAEVAAMVAALDVVGTRRATQSTQRLDRWRLSGRSWTAPVDDDAPWDRR